MVESIESTPRLGAHDFYCADKDTTINLEASPEKIAKTVINDKPFAHTNHCLNADMQMIEAPKTDLIWHHSRYRYQRMSELLESHSEFDMQLAWELLSDEQKSERQVCIYDQDKSGQYFDFSTIASVLMNPAEDEMWVCRAGSDQKQAIKL